MTWWSHIDNSLLHMRPVIRFYFFKASLTCSKVKRRINLSTPSEPDTDTTSLPLWKYGFHYIYIGNSLHMCWYHFFQILPDMKEWGRKEKTCCKPDNTLLQLWNYINDGHSEIYLAWHKFMKYYYLFLTVVVSITTMLLCNRLFTLQQIRGEKVEECTFTPFRHKIFLSPLRNDIQYDLIKIN